MADGALASVGHHERKRTIIRTAVSGFAAKAAMFLPTVVIAKLVLPILGTERFGVLMTILSLLAFLSVADLGVGASLVTSISRALGAGKLEHVRKLQANGFVAVSATAVVVLVAVITLYYMNIGQFIFPSSAPALRWEATRGFVAFGVLFALGLPLTLIGRIQLGLQIGHVANFWQIATAILNFSLGALAAREGLGIPWIIIGLMSGTLMCGLANLLVHYIRNPGTRPHRADLSVKGTRELLGESLFYLALQLIFVVAYAADTLIVARELGAGAASVFALSDRLFSVVGVAVAVITTPLWATYGEALGASDTRWAYRMLRVSTARITFVACVMATSVIVALPMLVSMLSSGRLHVPLSLAIAMAIWRIIESIGQSVSVYMYACQALKFVLLTGGATALVSLCVKVLLVSRLGLFSVPATMSTVYVLLCLLPACYYVWQARPR